MELETADEDELKEMVQKELSYIQEHADAEEWGELAQNARGLGKIADELEGRQ